MLVAGLHSERHVLDLVSVGDSLLSSATRYTWGPREKSTSFADVSGGQNPSPANAVTLVFLHGLGFHKETWEPTISHLFELERLSRQQRAGVPTIIEAWAIDCPDHGEAATLNRNSLNTNCSRVSCLSYGKAVLALLKSGLLIGPQGFRVVLVGHSAGATSLVLAAASAAESELQSFAAMVLIEPWMVARELEGDLAMGKLTGGLTRASIARLDAWNNREEANSYFKDSPAFRYWDRRVRLVYVDHGLRSFPTPEYPARETGLTLAFPKRLESEAYSDFSEGQAALNHMHRLAAATPLHLIFGAQQPPIVKCMQRSIFDHAGKTASVTYLPAVGHAAPQQSPALVARAIWEIVLNLNVRETPVSRGKL